MITSFCLHRTQLPDFLTSSACSRVLDIIGAFFVVSTACFKDGKYFHMAVYCDLIVVISSHIVRLQQVRETSQVGNTGDVLILWSITSLAIHVFGVLYIPLAIGYFIFLCHFNIGYAILVLWCSFQCDTGALVTGRLFGRHNAVTLISPKKTWEGFAGGFFTSILSTIFIWMLRAWALILPEAPLAIYIAVDGLVIFASIMGDLVASLLKRGAGEHAMLAIYACCLFLRSHIYQLRKN